MARLTSDSWAGRINNTRRPRCEQLRPRGGHCANGDLHDLAQLSHTALLTQPVRAFQPSLKEWGFGGQSGILRDGTSRTSPQAQATITLWLARHLNTNVTSARGLFSREAGSFLDASHETSDDQPLDKVVLGNKHDLFAEPAV